MALPAPSTTQFSGFSKVTTGIFVFKGSAAEQGRNSLPPGRNQFQGCLGRDGEYGKEKI